MERPAESYSSRLHNSRDKNGLAFSALTVSGGMVDELLFDGWFLSLWTIDIQAYTYKTRMLL